MDLDLVDLHFEKKFKTMLSIIFLRNQMFIDGYIIYTCIDLKPMSHSILRVSRWNTLYPIYMNDCFTKNNDNNYTDLYGHT